MAKFSLTINLNDAFVNDRGSIDGFALLEVLCRVATAADLEEVHLPREAYIYDINGNRCGEWEID